MIIPGTFCSTFDNSGVLTLACISLLRNTSKKGATICDSFVAAVKSINPKKKKIKFKKGSVCLALIIKLNRNICRWNKYYIKSEKIGVIIVNKEMMPLSKRLFGVVFRELWSISPKVMLLAELII